MDQWVEEGEEEHVKTRARPAREATESLERAEGSASQSAGGAPAGMELQMQHLPDPISHLRQQVRPSAGDGEASLHSGQGVVPTGVCGLPRGQGNATEPDPSAFPFSGTDGAQL